MPPSARTWQSMTPPSWPRNPTCSSSRAPGVRGTHPTTPPGSSTNLRRTVSRDWRTCAIRSSRWATRTTRISAAAVGSSTNAWPARCANACCRARIATPTTTLPPRRGWMPCCRILQKPVGCGGRPSKETPVTAAGHHDEAKHMDAGAEDLVKAGQPVRSQQVPTQERRCVRAACRSAYSRTNPFPARLLASRKLTLDGSEKDTRHYEICLQGSGLAYEVGDALGLLPANSPDLVQEILDALGFDGEEEVTSHDGAKKPIRLALSTTTRSAPRTRSSSPPSPNATRATPSCATCSIPTSARNWTSISTGARSSTSCWHSPKLGFTPEEFVKLLRKHQPRLYSIASSLKAHPEQVHLTVDTLRYEAHGRKRHGVRRTFLADRVTESTKLPVFVQTGQTFPPAGKRNGPVIMVGPGTGIAPFRAFLQERRATGAKGGNWLFFGAQKSATDFFYQEELEALQAERLPHAPGPRLLARSGGENLRPDAHAAERRRDVALAGGGGALLRLRRCQAHGQGRGRSAARHHPRGRWPERRRTPRNTWPP